MIPRHLVSAAKSGTPASHGLVFNPMKLFRHLYSKTRRPLASIDLVMQITIWLFRDRLMSVKCIVQVCRNTL